MLFNQDVINKFNKIEMDIYFYVQEHASEINGLKIRELASRLHISTASILRFCKKLGCSGYVEFKYKFKESLEQPMSTKLKNDVQETDRYFHFNTENEAEALERNRNILMIAELMKVANKIIFIGEGTSGVMAKYGALFLTMMGRSAQYIDVPYVPIPVEDHSHTIVIALSVSGETMALIDRLESFKNLDAKIVSITNGKDNSISQLADFSLHYNIPKEEFLVVGAKKVVIKVNGSSQISAMYLIESLVRACCMGTARKLT